MSEEHRNSRISAEALEELETKRGSEFENGLLRAISSALDDQSSSTAAAKTSVDKIIQILRACQDTETQLRVGLEVLQRLAPYIASFEEQDVEVRSLVSDAYIANHDWKAAAKILQTGRLESCQRNLDDITKARSWNKICWLYLKDNEILSAEIFLNKLKNIIFKLDDRSLQITFRHSQARIHDARLRFPEAATMYLDLSLIDMIEENERRDLLDNAIICATLAPVGIQRASILSRLYRDERVLQSRHFPIVKRICQNVLLPSRDHARFERNLKPHHLVSGLNGIPPFQHAMTEHNIMSVSCIYSNISISRLAVMLALAQRETETAVSGLIRGNRLQGAIDSVNGIIYFEHSSPSLISKDLDYGRVSEYKSSIQELTHDVERVFLRFGQIKSIRDSGKEQVRNC